MKIFTRKIKDNVYKYYCFLVSLMSYFLYLLAWCFVRSQCFCFGFWWYYFRYYWYFFHSFSWLLPLIILLLLLLFLLFLLQLFGIILFLLSFSFTTCYCCLSLQLASMLLSLFCYSSFFVVINFVTALVFADNIFWCVSIYLHHHLSFEIYREKSD